LPTGSSRGRGDLEGGSSRADSPFSDSGLRTPDTRPSPAAPVTLSASALADEGIDLQHAKDWLTARSRKKLPLTPTAWSRFKRNASQAGLTAAEAVELCAEKGWAGIDAEWVNGNAPAVGPLDTDTDYAYGGRA
jgi:hypothetical protein